ncbi:MULTISPECIES: nuclear transport factor 2 family protein [Amycolatopsis]|uniref:Nuclear transport factor 2 family protein n=1 Tax=Amycolatopsis thermalba TaxID=944492 RepID=A0ABY4NWY9_9PSEU|nr:MULTISPECIES: nuclear transport factor 2 family protein [Amycolatopsis]OXM72355.1 polyketide cyclase [Amycolatopsis sp. KNN50.9b]UQS24561.1 nuclear transport factor 2 family protein [Amycolatopsis thermalba]
MSDYTTLAHRYIDVWNETDADKRRALVEDLFTPDATYTDPLGAVRGTDGIDGFVAGAQAQFAGLTFSLGGAVDGHHDQARFTWHLGAPGAAEPLVIGFDVVVIDNGRISQVLGFLDKVPS